MMRKKGEKKEGKGDREKGNILHIDEKEFHLTYSQGKEKKRRRPKKGAVSDILRKKGGAYLPFPRNRELRGTAYEGRGRHCSYALTHGQRGKKGEKKKGALSPSWPFCPLGREGEKRGNLFLRFGEKKEGEGP